ncbi:hypothetical protein [Methyloterricola oryzae]|uniref:hypothetical protein n=1 Tax=Methyloterricola oryzae TaxID=1495050 RepID=UPI00069C5728|nr:hypothetical protein [Methyloterricola oryzae]
MNNKKVRPLALAAIASAVALASQGAIAHTRLQTPTVASGANVYNATATTHGCHNAVTNSNSTPVIATSVVFPDESATVQIRDAVPAGQTANDYVAYEGSLEDFVDGGAVFHPDKVKSRDVFNSEDIKRDPTTSNSVGFYAKDGSLPGLDYISLLPFRPGAVFVNEGSCAKSVQYVLAIADICKVTSKTKFSDEVVNLWTPAVGSDFDGPGLHGFNSPATLTVTRSTPLDASCGLGQEVRVVPTAAQINRDLPIPRYWPSAR